MTQYGYGFNKDGSLLFDLTNYQRDVMAANEEFDRSNSETGLGDRLITEVDYGPPSGVDTEFFPLDYLTNEDSGLDKAAVEVRAKIDLLKSYIDDVSKAESAARQDSFLAKQTYKTDLIFIVSEINGALAQWGTGGSAAVSNRRLRQLVSLLKTRIEGVK